MNVNTLNISHYRLTDTSGRKFDLFNRKTNEVFTLTTSQYADIMHHQSVEMCDFMCDTCRRAKA